MRDWFEALETREKLFVSVGAVFVIVALLYAMVWLPLEKGYAAKTARVSDFQTSLVELRSLQGRVQTGAPGSGANAGSRVQAPIIIVDQTLRSRGLEQFRRRSQPTTSNGIRVEFENVAFDELVLWLGDLSAQHDMHVQAGSLSVSNRSAPGRINANLTLERSP